MGLEGGLGLGYTWPYLSMWALQIQKKIAEIILLGQSPTPLGERGSRPTTIFLLDHSSHQVKFGEAAYSGFQENHGLDRKQKDLAH